MEFNLFDVVATKDDVNEFGIKKGLIGTIIYIYSPNSFEVEFISEDGATFVNATLDRYILCKIMLEEKIYIRKITTFYYG